MKRNALRTFLLVFVICGVSAQEEDQTTGEKLLDILTLMLADYDYEMSIWHEARGKLDDFIRTEEDYRSDLHRFAEDILSQTKFVKADDQLTPEDNFRYARYAFYQAQILWLGTRMDEPDYQDKWHLFTGLMEVLETAHAALTEN